LDNRTESFTARVSAVPEGSYLRLLDPRPLEVRVVVDATPVERSFDGIPVVVRGGSSGDQVEPAAVDVVLAGPPALIGSLAREQIVVVADISGLQPDGTEHRVPLRVDFSGVPFEDQALIDVKWGTEREVTVRPAGQVI
jgi:hypothetical protein